MARPNRPVTINDLRSSGQSHRSNAGSRSNDENHKKNAALLKQPTTKQYTANPSLDPKILHIPSLPLEKECRNMLERVVREFLPIIQRRGYNVASISELCCCGDGLDSAGGRKRRKMAHNILGYNQTTSFGGKSNKRHTIHLRLRHPSSHNDRLYCYEEVAGTLAHELAHCEHSPHNDSFFKLMDEILDEHATLMASGVVGTGHNGASMALPAFSGTGHVLGGTSGTATANDVQQARLQAVGGTKLGGDNRFTQWMTPREAAVAAAMLRNRQQQLRLRGNRCCQPCNLVVSNEDNSSDSSDNEVEILETDPELAKQNPIVRVQQQPRKAQKQQPKRALLTACTANEKETDQDSKPRSAGPSKKGKTSNNNLNIIDLTGSNSDEEGPVAAAMAVAFDAPGADCPWPCRFCTYVNIPACTVCEVCNHPRYAG